MSEQRVGCWSTEVHRQMVEYTSDYLGLFVQKHAKVTRPEAVFLKVAQLSSGDLRRLSHMHFLLSDEARELITVIAPAILKRLSKTSVQEFKTNRNVVQGRVHWGRTYAVRSVMGGDPSLFVTAKKSSEFDLPENRLLLYMLHQVVVIARSVIKESWDEEKFDLDENQDQKWGTQIRGLVAQCLKLLRNPYVSRIDQLPHLTEQIVEQTAKVRGERYSRLAHVARTYIQSNKEPLTFLQQRQKILEPLSKDTLFEIAVLFTVIQTATEAGWIEKSGGLIGGNSHWISKMEKDECVLKVYYQTLPARLAERGRYKPLMSKHGLSDRDRRPDLVLEWVAQGKIKYYIIEVKRSVRRSYLAEGAYKVLGYLKDYEGVQEDGTELKGVLVGWGGIHDVLPESNQEVYVTSWDNLENTLRVVLS